MSDHPPDGADDGLVWCERCRQRVPPEVRDRHVNGSVSGAVRPLTDWDEQEEERAAAAERERARWRW